MIRIDKSLNFVMAMTPVTKAIIDILTKMIFKKLSKTMFKPAPNESNPVSIPSRAGHNGEAIDKTIDHLPKVVLVKKYTFTD